MEQHERIEGMGPFQTGSEQEAKFKAMVSFNRRGLSFRRLINAHIDGNDVVAHFDTDPKKELLFKKF